jgi:hypothetical protein
MKKQKSECSLKNANIYHQLHVEVKRAGLPIVDEFA